MKVAFITRATLYKVPGGDTEQIIQTTRHLNNTGIEADILLTDQAIDYNKYDLFHFSNIIRPSDILYHIKRCHKPFVISPNFIDYSEFDRKERKGLSGRILSLFSRHGHEYLKTIGRWVLGRDILRSKSFITRGQKGSIIKILRSSSMVLPSSSAEMDDLRKSFHTQTPFSLVPNGIDSTAFVPNGLPKNGKLVVCAARIEGIKNQLNLIRALNNSEFLVTIIGDAAPGQNKYYQNCRQLAAENIRFSGRLSHRELAAVYKQAKVHVLPSWFETCGLSSMEAAAMGCNIVVSDRGFVREYFGIDAFYCDPADPESILEAVRKASAAPLKRRLQEKILENYTWEKTTEATIRAYKKILPG